MIGIHDLGLFVASGLLLNITPGPDTLYVVGRSTTLGWRAGSIAALGIGTGTLVHILAASLGLSALLAASATAFAAVKLIGAAYLVYVGVSMILSSRAQSVTTTRSGAAAFNATPAWPAAPAAQLRSVFLQGFFTNVLNPKVALFFLAFLPQFVESGAPSKATALLVLGCIFDVTGTTWNLFVAWSAARISRRVSGDGSWMRWFNRCVGSLFVYVGIKLALAGER